MVLPKDANDYIEPQSNKLKLILGEFNNKDKFENYN